MSTVIAEQNVYGAQFSSMREHLPGSHRPWVERLRQKGMDDFLALGFPTTKLENWKYTNVAPLRRITFQPPIDQPLPPIRKLDSGQTRLVFVNGRFDPAFSTIDVRLNFHLRTIREALRDRKPASGIENHLGRYTRTSDHAFAAWNTAFFTDGAYIELPRGSVCEQPIHLVFIAAGNTEPWACHPRNLIVAGEGSQITLNGLVVADGRRLIDNHTRIDHLRPHASSREIYKGVLAGNAEGVFNGAIAVHENAQKTDAVQYSKNLLLSTEAQINTKPQLEIRNNDVRCFHGATIGQIDNDAVFYLNSRGIAEDDAKRILIRGFAGEIIDAIRVPKVRDELEYQLNEWLQSVLEAS